ncbi:replication-associated recombination protein A, partial [Psychrobacter sp. SIMBA_152]
NSTYTAITAVMALAENDASFVPLHLSNGVTKLMRSQGYGKGYAYTHDYPTHYYPPSYLPDNLIGTSFYESADNQRAQHSKQFM